jgi:hypothetical protein
MITSDLIGFAAKGLDHPWGSYGLLKHGGGGTEGGLRLIGGRLQASAEQGTRYHDGRDDEQQQHDKVPVYDNYHNDAAHQRKYLSNEPDQIAREAGLHNRYIAT